MSFLPSIVSPLVANAAGAGDLEGVQERVGEAVFLASILGLSGMFCLTLFPHKALNIVLATDAPVRVFATPYLAIRALTILPAMLSTVAFAAFRGTQEFVTPLKISLAANLVNFCLDPLLIFKGKMGVTGAAAATCASELVSFVLFARTLVKRKMVRASRLFKPPSFTKLKPILLGGLGVQARIVSVNAALLTVTRTTQMVDKTGTAAAAHAITSQLWQLGGIFLLAMSTVAGIIVPTEAAKAKRDGYPEGLLQARKTANRLLAWGLICGIALGGIQLMMLPLLAGLAPTPEVSKAARVPSIIASVMQIMNGVMFVGEGIQTGNQAFTSLALCTAVGSLAMITCLRSLGNSLVGVWIGYSVFTVIRLMGVLRHHFLTGPLAPKHIGREYLLAKHGLEGAK
jgi:putative MATE family efflux protein